MDPTSQTPSRILRTAEPDSMLHWVLLGVAAGVLTLSCVLRVESSEQVVMPVINQALPGICTYKTWFGIGCPGCGLTRCFISLAHGDFSAAWRFNPAGILFFAVAVGQLPLRTWQLWRIRRGLAEIRLGWVSTGVFWSLFATLFLQWIMRTFIFGE